MIPIRDDAPRFATPYVTYVLIGLNTVIFLLMWVGFPAPAQQLVNDFGFVPLKITALLRGYSEIQTRAGMIPINPMTAIVPVFTSMFLHASWFHVLINMWFLWIFGDNVEDYLGHFWFLVLYLSTGILGTGLHVVLNPLSAAPGVGASGAIAGVMGAYLILFPSARVTTLVPFLFIFFVQLPAWLVLGYWFVLQFLSGTASSIVSGTQTSGGTAFWAHVGGFAAGVALIKLFPRRPRRYHFVGW